MDAKTFLIELTAFFLALCAAYFLKWAPIPFLWDMFLLSYLSVFVIGTCDLLFMRAEDSDKPFINEKLSEVIAGLAFYLIWLGGFCLIPLLIFHQTYAAQEYALTDKGAAAIILALILVSRIGALRDILSGRSKGQFLGASFILVFKNFFVLLYVGNLEAPPDATLIYPLIFLYCFPFGGFFKLLRKTLAGAKSEAPPPINSSFTPSSR